MHLMRSFKGLSFKSFNTGNTLIKISRLFESVVPLRHYNESMYYSVLFGSRAHLKREVKYLEIFFYYCKLLDIERKCSKH